MFSIAGTMLTKHKLHAPPLVVILMYLHPTYAETVLTTNFSYEKLLTRDSSSFGTPIHLAGSRLSSKKRVSAAPPR
jgi:hypothetical protein